MTSSFFTVAWAVVLFLVLRFFAKGYFREAGRATVASAAVAVTFLGTSLAHSDFETSPSPQAPAAPQSIVTPIAGNPTIRNVSATCQTASITPSSGGAGHVDIVKTPQADLHAGDTVSSAGKIIIAGWAADDDRKNPGHAVCAIIDGQIVRSANAVYGISRADVAVALHSDSASGTGFALEIPEGYVSAGSHQIGAAVQSNDGKWNTIDGALAISIK